MDIIDNDIDIEQVKRILSRQCSICAIDISYRPTDSNNRWNLCRDCTNEHTRRHREHPALVDYIMYTATLNRLVSSITNTMRRQVSRIIRETSIGSIIDNIDLHKRLSAWYADAPDDIELQDIEHRSRLQEIRESIPPSLHYRLDRGDSADSPNVDVYVRPRGDSMCPSCGITLDPPEDVTFVQCGLCKYNFNWNTLERADEQGNVIDTFSHYTSERGDVIRNIMRSLPQYMHQSMLSDIFEVLAIDNRIERYIAEHTRGYTTAECIMFTAYNRLYRDSDMSDNMARACILRDLNVQQHRSKLLSLLEDDIRHDKNTGKILSMMRYYYDLATKVMRGDL